MAEDPLHHDIVTHHDKVLIVDFGSQVTQLIARRVREAGVYCEIAPYQKAEAAFADLKPKAVILSGGPASVLDEGSPRAPQAIFEAGVPILGICYGEQLMAAQLGGEVQGGHHGEYRPRRSRGDRGIAAARRRLGAGPPYRLDEPRRPRDQTAAGLQQHRPFAQRAGLRHRRRGAPLLRRCNSIPRCITRPRGRSSSAIFVFKIAGFRSDWTMRAFRAEAIKAIRAQVGQGRVLCALSGGVDFIRRGAADP